jgi:hypothetical protein
MTGTVRHRRPMIVSKSRAIKALATGYEALMSALVQAEIHADVMEPLAITRICILAITLIYIEEY